MESQLALLVPGQLVGVVTALARLQYLPHPSWMHSATEAAVQQAHALSPQQVAALLGALAELQHRPPAAALAALLAAARPPAQTALDAAAAVQCGTALAQGLARLRYQPPSSWLHEWAAAVQPGLAGAPCHALLALGAALMQLRFRPMPEWLACWCSAAVALAAAEAAGSSTCSERGRLGRLQALAAAAATASQLVLPTDASPAALELFAQAVGAAEEFCTTAGAGSEGMTAAAADSAAPCVAQLLHTSAALRLPTGAAPVKQLAAVSYQLAMVCSVPLLLEVMQVGTCHREHVRGRGACQHVTRTAAPYNHHYLAPSQPTHPLSPLLYLLSGLGRCAHHPANSPAGR